MCLGSSKSNFHSLLCITGFFLFFRWTKASLKWPLIIIIMLCRVDAISESWRSQKSTAFSFFRGLACNIWYDYMCLQSSSIYIMQSNYFSDPWSVTCSCAPNPKLQRLFQLLAALEGTISVLLFFYQSKLITHCKKKNLLHLTLKNLCYLATSVFL